MGTPSDIKPSSDYSRIEEIKRIAEFKAQNQDYLTRFVNLIRSNDIIVADLTNNNPSVHLELGIALTFNKNILRVSGRDLAGVATDLQGYAVNRYVSRQQLYDRITSDLDYFLLIKQQKPVPINSINGFRLGSSEDRYVSLVIEKSMRDVEISVHFRFEDTKDDTDWFAILVRSSIPDPWRGGGYFVYVRKNGSLEVRRMTTIEQMRPDTPPSSSWDKETEHVLRVSVDGEYLNASLDEELEKSKPIDKLENQSPGIVAVACHRSRVAIRNVEFVNHDTIVFPDSLQ